MGSRARPARLFRKRCDDLLGQNATQGQCTGPGGVVFASCPTASVNPAPGHRAVVIAVGRKLVDTRGALLKRLLAIAFEHQVGGSPNIDLRYDATKGARLRSKPVNFVCPPRPLNLPVGTFEFANESDRFLPRGPQDGFNATCDER